MKKMILALFVLSFGVTALSFANDENPWTKSKEWRRDREKRNHPPRQEKPSQAQ